jgi:hypothetical protein
MFDHYEVSECNNNTQKAFIFLKTYLLLSSLSIAVIYFQVCAKSEQACLLLDWNLNVFANAKNV